MSNLIVVGALIFVAAAAIAPTRMGRWSAGGVVGVFLVYPTVSTLMPRVPQSYLLGAILFAGCGLAFGQRHLDAGPGSGRFRALYWALTALCVEAALTFHPAGGTPQLELRFAGAVLVCALALHLARRIDSRAALVVLVLVEVLSTAELLQGGASANAIWVARSVMLAGLWWGLLAQSRKVRLLVWVAHFGVLVAIGKQGPIVGMIVGLMTWWFLGSRGPGRLLLVLVGSLTAVVASSSSPVRQGAVASVDDLGTASERIELWRQALEQWQFAPALGNGFGSFVGSAGEKLYAYPHNVFLEALAELGLVGLALLTVCVIVMGRAAREAGGLSIYLAALAAASVSGSLVVNHEYWIIGLTCVALRPPLREPKTQRQDTSRDGPRGTQSSLVSRRRGYL